MMYISGLQFFDSIPVNSNFNQVSGIYLIVNANNVVIDVGETDNLKDRMSSHEREFCWRINSVGNIALFFHYDDNQQTRLSKEAALRNKFNPICGER